MDIQEIRQKYPQYNDMSDGQLAQALHAKYYSDIPFADFSKKIGLGQDEERPAPSMLSRAAAGASGFNSSALANIPGMAVDAALNVADLARAAYGGIGKATGMLRTDQMPDMLDRSKYVGSSDWIKNRIRDVGGGVLIDNPNPEDQVSRVLHTVGASAVGKNPSQAAAGATAGLSQGVAAEMGASPEVQILASLAPGAAKVGALEASKVALAGGSKSRAQMRDNINTLSDAGVQNPSAGLAGPRQSAAVEALAGRYPGSAGVMAANAQGVQNDLANTVRGLAAGLSANRGEAATGLAMQQDITGRWKPKFDDIYNRLDEAVGQRVGNARVPLDNTLATTGLLSTGVPGAPSVSGLLLGSSKIPKLNDALLADANIPAENIRATIPSLKANLDAAQNRYNNLVQQGGMMQAIEAENTTRGANWYPVPGMPRVPGGISNFPERSAEAASAYRDVSGMIPQRRQEIGSARTAVEDAQRALSEAQPSIPYDALRGVGQIVGKEAGDKLLHGSAEAGRYKQVYGAIAQDKADAANAAGAGRELARGNKFYSEGVSKMENLLGGFTKEGVPAEQAYNRFRNMVFSSPSQAYSLRRSLSEDVRKSQTATLIDELGQATPGKQNSGGTQFSSETFLTNWNKISPEAKAVIFSGFKDAGNVRTQLDKVAKAAELIRNKSGIYANPSGTSGAAMQAGVAGGAGAAALSGNLPALGAILGSTAAANLTARLMTNPKFVSWLASSAQIATPEAARNHTLRLGAIANSMSGQDAEDLRRLMASLSE